jgi:hypothetical protein
MPTNHKIIDPFTFYKNFKVDTVSSVLVGNSTDFSTIASSNTDPTLGTTSLKYKKLLPLFTYKNMNIVSSSGDTADTIGFGIIEPTSSRFKRYSEANGTFGYDKMNKPDINAVPLGF